MKMSIRNFMSFPKTVSNLFFGKMKLLDTICEKLYKSETVKNKSGHSMDQFALAKWYYRPLKFLP